MSKLENVGVLLTSHDAGDLEALCHRVIIINHGQIVYQDKVSNLKRKFLTHKLVEVRYAEEVPPGFRARRHGNAQDRPLRRQTALRHPAKPAPTPCCRAFPLPGRWSTSPSPTRRWKK